MKHITGYFVLLVLNFNWNIVFGSNSSHTLYPDSFVNSPAKDELVDWASKHPISDAASARNPGGIQIPSLTASLAIGTNGNILLQDVFLLEKTAAFNRERIPERVVHAKAAGAFGTFTLTHDISHLTKAGFLNGIGKRTKVAARFSTVGGEKGSADTAIDPKGFAIKFYTEEGIHDLVGNNIEVFPIRDPMLFTDLNHSRKKNPATNLGDATMFWDFAALRPESIFHTLHLFSYLGFPSSLRKMDGAGVHTYKMVSSSGHPVYVKFHWKSNQGKEHFSREQYALLAGANPDYMTQDLYDAIAQKNFPSWELMIQVMSFEQAQLYPRNPFDVTKFWRREEYPLIPVGRMELNRNPLNYFAEIEQLAMNPGNMVPGIEASPDRMLHARMFSYADAQRYRLGVNYQQIPVNHPGFEVQTYSRDGRMTVTNNGAGEPNYFPNSFHGLRESQTSHEKQSVFNVTGDVDRHDSGDEDNFIEARVWLEKDIDAKERMVITENIADFLNKADVKVQKLFLQNNAYPVSKVFGDELRTALCNGKYYGIRSKVWLPPSKDDDGIC